MAHPPVVSGEQVRHALERAGFTVKSRKGSHLKMAHTDGRIAIVPMHREVAWGTLRSIRRQARLTEDEFRSFL
jgi:predicted RNA binding protein YcfA (HicA-like mRNA interferase family)